MMKLPPRPVIYQINTAVWLHKLGAEQGKAPLRFDQVPEHKWDELASLPIDAVWFMGVWQRSPAGVSLAKENADLMIAMNKALPDLADVDIIGSPYCIRDYVVDQLFGAEEALSVAREKLANRGIALILDYVPNHVAPDHPWLTDAPENLIRGDQNDLEQCPGEFLEAPGGSVARGRDPYSIWPDTAQLNAFSTSMRVATVDLLSRISSMCDGVRCDMAMLMINDVFAKTWGKRAGKRPKQEFWPLVIGMVKAVNPDFTFLAEAYWDMEEDLHRQGFDYCYDKRFYDYLVEGDNAKLRHHLLAGQDYQDQLVRFIENHDEPRAAATFPEDKARAVALALSTVPGARLYHDGQFEGALTHITVFLGRGPEERIDHDLVTFYRNLLDAVRRSGLQEAKWSLAELNGWPDNGSFRNMVAWQWEASDGPYLVVLNLSDHRAQARVSFAVGDRSQGEVELCDVLDGRRFSRSAGEIARDGMFVELEAWKYHFLRIGI